MPSPRRALALLLLGLGSVAGASTPSPSPAHVRCSSALAALESALEEAGSLRARPPDPPPPPAAAASAPPLLFHLHVPRTAGRTFHACLLTPGVPPHQRCDRAYFAGGGEAALSASTPCRLLASHDDASLVAGRDGGGLVTLVTVRDPVARILSAYEFATEGAALRLLNGTAAVEGKGQEDEAQSPPLPPRAQRRRKKKKKRRGVGSGRGAPTTSPPTPVDAVWPWSALIPWLAEAMAANGGKPMPLAAFVEAPLVRETLHEGAALQVLGSTTAGSGPPGVEGLAAGVRSACVGVPGAAGALADAAVARLAAAAHVGVAEEVDASVVAAAAALGWDLAAPAADTRGRTLGEAFRACEARTAARAASRRASAAAALGGVGPLEGQFSGGRRGVPQGLIDRIRRLNAADVEVHAASKALLAERLAALEAAGPVARLPPRVVGRERRQQVGRGHSAEL